MNSSTRYKKTKQKQSKLYTVIALLDVVALAASFMIILNAI